MDARDRHASAERDVGREGASSPTLNPASASPTRAHGAPAVTAAATFRGRVESGEVGGGAGPAALQVSDAEAALATLLAVLTQLDTVAEDRIRDAKAAKSLLTALIRCVKAVRKHAAVLLPTQRILDRLCYYANARDSGIRSGTFRAARYVVVSESAAIELVHTRLMLSIVRSLEREPKYLWERVQALKLARAIVEVSTRRAS